MSGCFGDIAACRFGLAVTLVQFSSVRATKHIKKQQYSVDPVGVESLSKMICDDLWRWP